MDLNDVKAGDYELVAELFDQPTSKPGDPVFLYKRYIKGDIVTLDEDEAKRLVSAGAVVEPGAFERAQLAAAKAAYEAALAALPPDPNPPVPAGPSEPVYPEGEPTEAWTIDQLRAYALAKEVDLKGLTAKADILKAVPGLTS